MNLSEAQNELFARGFDFLTATRATLFLNDARNQFEDAFPFPWLDATTTGPAPLVIADLKHVLFVTDTTNNLELTGVPASQIVAEMDPNITTTGVPVVWWLDGEKTITTYPVSSVGLRVRYLKESPELSAPGDTPLIPARYHQVWLDLAQVRAYIDSDNYAAAMALKNLADQELERIAERYATRNRQNPAYQTIRGYSEDW